MRLSVNKLKGKTVKVDFFFNNPFKSFELESVFLGQQSLLYKNHTKYGNE